MHPTTEYLLSLTEQSYDNYNAILPEIKDLLADPDRVAAFEQVLTEELPLTTARRAYRSAIKIAMGEDNVYREWRPSEVLARKFNKNQNR
jgi:hypothetical protein